MPSHATPMRPHSVALGLAVALAAVLAGVWGGVAAGQGPGTDVDVSIGGVASPDATRPIRLSANGYGPGLAVDEEGTTHVGWLEPRPGARDVVRYCRVVRPGTACGDGKTFTPPGTAPRRGAERDSTAVLVLSPRPETVVLLVTREAPVPEGDTIQRPLLVDAGGQVRASCGAGEGCREVPYPVISYVSNDAGRTFEERVLGNTPAAWGATAMTLAPGTPGQQERIATYGFGAILSARVPPPLEFAGDWTSPANLNVGPGSEGLDANVFPQGAAGTAITALGDRPLVARESDGLFVRRFPRAGATEAEIVDRANWAPWERVGAGASVRLAASNGRAFLLTLDRRGGGRGWVARDVTRPGAPANQSLGGASRSYVPAASGTGDIAFDGGQGFGAAWFEATGVDFDGRFNSRLRRYALRFARAGADGRFADPTDLVSFVNARTDNGLSRVEQVRLSLVDDGGGAVVLQRAAGLDGERDPASIELVVFGSRTPRPFDDVRVTGAEVTQGVQSASALTRDRNRPDQTLNYRDPGRSDARLVQGKPTIVRVYASVRRAGAGAPPPMTLRVRRGSKVVSTLMPTPPSVALPVGDAFSVPPAQHAGTNQVYTFVVPPVEDFAGYTFEALVNPPGVLPAYPECGRCRGVDNVLRIGVLQFFPTTTVDVLPIELNVGRSASERPRAAAAGPNAVFANAATVLPVRLGVRPWVSSFSLAGLARANLSPEERQDEALDIVEWWSDDTDNEVSSRFPIGIYPSDSRTFGAPTPQAVNGYWLRGGKYFNEEYLDPASCWVDDCVQALYRDRQPIAVLGDARPTGDTRDVTLIAHEITHGLGFPHAGTDRGCYTEDDQVGALIPPLGPDGRMDGIGLDTRGGVPPFTRVVSNPASMATTVYDLMSYCFARSTQAVPAWMSLYSWNSIGAYFAPAPRRQAVAARAATTGLAVRPARTAQENARTLVVTAAVPRGAAAGRIVRVRPDDHVAAPITGVRRPGPYVLVARDARGAERFRAALERRTTVEAGTRLEALRGWVPRDGVASVEIVRADTGATVARRAASRNAPKVRILAPRGGATVGGGKTVEVRWDASDADRDRLEAWVEYAADGRRFRPVGFEPRAERATLPARLFPRGGRARVRVRVLDGFHEAAATSRPFRSRGTPPAVEILAPAPRGGARAEASLLLRAAAFDDAGKRLRSVTWRVRGRVVARGAEATALLPAGRVRLTAEARDARGRVGRQTVVVPVAAATPRFAVLTGPRRVGRRARTVVLRVASTFPATFSIAGRRYDVGPTVRRVTLRLGSGRREVSFRGTLRSGSRVTRARITVVRR